METPREHRCLLYVPREAGASLTPIFGLTAAERTVLSFRKAGVRSFVLVGDPEASAQLACRLGSIRRVRVRMGPVPVLKGDEAVFVARSDVHYDRRLIWRFVDETRGIPCTLVAVDQRHVGGPESEGVGQAALHPSGSLRALGRELMGADGVVVGLALANSHFVRILSEADPGERAFEAALGTLVQREPVATCNVTEFWQPLRKPADAAAARRKLLAGAVGFGDGIVAHHVNRRISRRITERLVSRDVKPWQISVASFVGTLGAGLSFAMGHAATGGLLAQGASVLDCVDGEVARIRYQDSPFGGVYDALLDRIGDAAVIGGMTLYAWLMGAGLAAVALGFAAVAGSSLSMLVKEKYGTQFHRPYTVEQEGRWRWLLLGRDGRLFLALVAGVTGYVEAVLAYMAVGTHLHAGVRLYRIRTETAGA